MLFWTSLWACDNNKVNDIDGDGFEESVDCDDLDPDIHPDAEDLCDGVDNNCDGVVDEGAKGGGILFLDQDGDGYGHPDESLTSCKPLSGYVDNDLDCDDHDAQVHPGADLDSCDCDQGADDTDQDGDGANACRDCDDNNAAVSPDADEVCDEIDNNCNDLVDENAVDGTTYYPDLDGDGYGDIASATQVCDTIPKDKITKGGDCNDKDKTVNTEGIEICDGVDNDCNSLVDDDAIDILTWYTDDDGDGFGGATTLACEQPDNTTNRGDDCDDTNTTIYPGSDATEVPNDGLDMDCDGKDFCTDLNCDGITDLVVTRYRDADLTAASETVVFFGDGTGFNEKESVVLATEGAWDVGTGDFNGDGYQDVVVAESDTGLDGSPISDSIVHYGSPTGFLTSDDLAVFGGSNLAVADFNKDGYDDVVIAAGGTTGFAWSNSSMVFYGSSKGLGVVTDSLTTAPAEDVEVGDIDNDGYIDIAFCSPYDSDWTVDNPIYFGSATGFSSADRTTVEGKGCMDIELSDIDLDGDLDLIVPSWFNGTDYASSDNYVYFWNGSTFQLAWSLPGDGVAGAAVGDLTGDGYPEIVFGSFEGHAVYVYPNASGSFCTSCYEELAVEGVYNPLIAEVTGDDINDLILPKYLYYWGKETWYYTSGTSVFAGDTTVAKLTNVDSLATDGAYGVAATDLRGTGSQDLIVVGHHVGLGWDDYRTEGSHTVIYYNDGSTDPFDTGNRDLLQLDGAWAVTPVGPER